MTTPLIQRRNALRLQEQNVSPSTRLAILQEQVRQAPPSQPLVQQQFNTAPAVQQFRPIADSILPIGTMSERLASIRSISERDTAATVQQAAARKRPAPVMPTGASVSVSQATYSGRDAQLADYARKAGFPEDQIPIAIAIMKAESGGNPRAVNTANRNGSTDTGIFQINSIHSGWTKSLDLYDPYQNAKAAYKIWTDAGKKWTPWAAYNNNSYAKHLKQPTSISPAPNAIQPYAVPSGTSGIRAVAVKNAQQVIGLPYVWGGNSLSKGVDCSGLVQQIYKQLGMSLPRTAHEQSISGRRVALNQLKPGDLVAWQGGWRGPNYVGHIAIYAGNGQIVEAPRRGVPVRQRALRPGEKAFGVALNFAGE